jgi:hypothetical protein
MSDSTLIVVLVAVGLAAAGGGFFFLRLRKGKEEPVHYFRCPGCHRKLRYHARQVGHKGMCGHCKEQLTFPPLPRGAQ